RVLGAARRQSCALMHLAFEPTEHRGLARLRLTFDGGDAARLALQLTRLVDVVEVHEAAPDHSAPHVPQTDIAVTPFHSQADGSSPGESDAESLDTHPED